MKYSALDKINFLINTYGRMFAAVFRFSTWSGFLLLAIFQLVGLFAFVKFYSPGIFQVVHPLLSYFLPPLLFHYPQYYLALPTIYSGYENFIIGPTVWVVLSAFAVYRLNGYYRGAKTAWAESFARAFGAYPQLLLLWALETATVLITVVLPSKLIAGYIVGSPQWQLALNTGLQLLAFMILAFLIYVIPGVIAGGQKIGTAILRSLDLCRRNFFLTYFLVLLPNVAKMAIDFVLSEFSPRIVKSMNPEIIVWLLAARILFGIFINLFIYGTAVFVYKKMS